MRRVAAKIVRVGAAQTVRVAIYTRKSTEEGLEQEFNSLDAQRLACEQHVAGQGVKGWTALAERYDDGGFTGANTDRPAFQRLMGDAEAGRIDVVCVHKVDRISRSLADFVRVTAQLQSWGVSFVSATQPFETGTPVGRMTLSLLAVFAEFEREMISERTRLKIHATRKRGGWTGGPVPLGYDLVDGRLVPNEAEAATVRATFAAFVECGSVIGTLERAVQAGWRTKSWTTVEGKVVPARAFTKSTLRSLLANPIYVGRVRLGAETHQGAQDAILDTGTFEAAQELISRRDPQASPKAAPKHSVLLRGLVECAVCGSAFKTAWTRRGPRTHGSYVCAKADKQGASACPGSRVPVARLEAAVVERVRFIGRDPVLVDATIHAARAAIDSRVPELAVAIRRHEQDRARLERKRANVLEAVADGGGASLNGKVADLDAEIARADERIAAAHAERERLAGTTIDEGELRRLLADFDPLWAAMFPSERARVLALLLERITVNGRTGDVAMHFR